MRWADRFREIEVRTNADTPEDAKLARQFGAEGIGLCRTEHMFFDADRILAMREMILASDTAGRERALAKLLPMQRGDFAGIFGAMEGLPVTIRLLDPPLHEFLPRSEQEIREVATALGVSSAEVRGKVESLREWNPMLGHRGCRLGITFPEIYRMQVRAIAEAANDVAESGVRVRPEIMVPLVSHVAELQRLRSLVEDEIRAVRRERRGSRVRPAIGTMIEAFALSRDDAGRFLPTYLESGILPDDPFVSIDEDGIGALVQLGVERGRESRPNLKVGICGEHGGDPKSVDFCARIGLDYVSCSPYRVPVARLAGAQAALSMRARRGRAGGA
jgi:pyruvate,orthophosphate dikinase